MAFHVENCTITSQREQVNKFVQHRNAKYRENNYRTFLTCNFTRALGSWKRTGTLYSGWFLFFYVFFVSFENSYYK